MAHGQPSDPEPAEAALADLAARVDRLTPELRVRSATLAAPGRLEAEAENLCGGGMIYPLFMAAGWFVTSVLPKRLPDRDLAILPPLGHDPGLPGLTARMLRAAAEENGWQTGGLPVLLAAHGSAKGKQAGADARAFAEKLAALMPEYRIVTGFVEEEPFIAQAAEGLGPRSLCLPYFALGGGHVRDDIPQGLAQAGFEGRLLPEIGKHGDIPALIAGALDVTRQAYAAQ